MGCWGLGPGDKQSKLTPPHLDGTFARVTRHDVAGHPWAGEGAVVMRQIIPDGGGPWSLPPP